MGHPLFSFINAWHGDKPDQYKNLNELTSENDEYCR